MEIDKDGFLYKYAYSINSIFWKGWPLPEQTNLCLFFWKIVGTTLLWSLIPIALGGIGILVFKISAVTLWHTLKTIGLFSGIMLIYCIVSYGLMLAATSEPAYVLGEYLRAKKNKWCPIVTFKSKEIQ